MNAENLLSFAASLVLCAGLATAQELDGSVVRNNDDTVTYDIDLDGPPRGNAQLFLGLHGAWPHIPTPVGPLLIDPVGLLPFGTCRLDASGQGQFTSTVPERTTRGVPFRFQVVYTDPTGGLCLAPVDLVLLHDVEANAAPSAPPARFAMSQTGDANDPAVTARFKIGGVPGEEYLITVFDDQGNTVATKRVRIGANGSSPVAEFGDNDGVERGHRWTIARDIGHGHVLPLWNGTFS